MRILCLFLVTLSGLYAGWDEVRGVGKGERVEVVVRKAPDVRGTFVSASETGMVVRDKSGERTVARDTIRKVRVRDSSRRGRNGVIGAGIGLAVGIGIGFAVCPGCAGEGAGGKYVGPGAVVGAGLGAAAGLLPTPYRTIYSN